MLSMRIPHLQWPINHELQCSNANQRHLPENIAYKQFLDQDHLLFWPVTGCRHRDKCPKSVNFFSSTPSFQNKQSIQERKQSWYLWWCWIFTGSGYYKDLGSPQKKSSETKKCQMLLNVRKNYIWCTFQGLNRFFRAVCRLPSN